MRVQFGVCSTSMSLRVQRFCFHVSMWEPEDKDQTTQSMNRNAANVLG